eukprot:TRINITY_DN658_c0_g1_i2.p1 TRINITY_DN658_c0_g1~~TRINITY_DN658_c0_g1_i2.p1  ORF type:complete len:1156 (-),score=353.75 TRINITY_DN658_c0_g1_i2:65-3532(-)
MVTGGRVILLLTALCAIVSCKNEVVNVGITAVPAPADCVQYKDTRPCRPVRPESRENAFPPGYNCHCPTNNRTATGGIVGANGTPSGANPEFGTFTDYVLASGFDSPIGIEFTDNTNEMFVASQKGYVYWVDLTTGQQKLYLDLSLETAYGADRGLMSISTSPDFENTRQIFLAIVVDPDQTDGLEPHTETAANQRLVRYSDLGNGNVDANSRFALFGGGDWDGVPTCFSSHSLGDIEFGWDGSLFITTGDGSRWDFQKWGDWGQNSLYSIDPRTNQIIPSLDATCDHFGDQDVGAFRSQVMYSLGGKILRLNPMTGDGICPDAPQNRFTYANPHCDNSQGKSIPSKIWARGLRNPFRMTVRPKTAADTIPNFPGVLYYGDVGQTGYEEINAVTRPGMNLGWPCWEGPFPTPTYKDSPYNDPSGPSLTNATGCPGWDDQCAKIVKIAKFPDGSRMTCDAIYQQLTTDLPFFYYNRFPAWNFEGNYGDAAYTGQGFNGASTAGIAFYEGVNYPARFHGAIFILDYSYKWVRVLTRNGDTYTGVTDFTDLVYTPPVDGGRVELSGRPSNGDICYATVNGGEVRCFGYTEVNQPPTPNLEYSQPDRTNALKIQFSSDRTLDREREAIFTVWNFGDGESSFEANPVHTYATAKEYAASLFTIDSAGNMNTGNLAVNAANLPPKVAIATPKAQWEKFVEVDEETLLTFSATVESTDTQLTYFWEFQFVHNNHIHPNVLSYTTPTFQIKGGALPKEEGADRGNLQLILTVTDSQGGVGTDRLRIAHEGMLADKGNRAPQPVITMDNRGYKYNIVGQPISFSGQMSVDPDADRIDCTWDMGDGFTASGVTTVHTFMGSAPSYTVTLTATDNWGMSNRTSIVIPMGGWSTPCDDLILNAQLKRFVCINQGFTAGPAGTITIPTPTAASAGLPTSAAEYFETSITKLSGTFTGDTSKLMLTPTQSGTGAAITAIVSYDWNGDGTWDRTETYPPFTPTANPATGYAGAATVTGAGFANLVNGTVRLQVWQSTPSADSVVSLLAGTSQQNGLTSHVKIPYTNTVFSYTFGDYAVPSTSPTSTTPSTTDTDTSTPTGNPTQTSNGNSNPTRPGSDASSTNPSRPTQSLGDASSCTTVGDTQQVTKPSDAATMSIMTMMTFFIVYLLI